LFCGLAGSSREGAEFVNGDVDSGGKLGKAGSGESPGGSGLGEVSASPFKPLLDVPSVFFEIVISEGTEYLRERE
jgi:hypothetical protein